MFREICRGSKVMGVDHTCYHYRGDTWVATACALWQCWPQWSTKRWSVTWWHGWMSDEDCGRKVCRPGFLGLRNPFRTRLSIKRTPDAPRNQSSKFPAKSTIIQPSQQVTEQRLVLHRGQQSPMDRLSVYPLFFYTKLVPIKVRELQEG